jgi:uncharacterized coiled-coil protein SlyX
MKGIPMGLRRLILLFSLGGLFCLCQARTLGQIQADIVQQQTELKACEDRLASAEGMLAKGGLALDLGNEPPRNDPATKNIPVQGTLRQQLNQMIAASRKCIDEHQKRLTALMIELQNLPKPANIMTPEVKRAHDQCTGLQTKVTSLRTRHDRAAASLKKAEEAIAKRQK